MTYICTKCVTLIEYGVGYCDDCCAKLEQELKTNVAVIQMLQFTIRKNTELFEKLEKELEQWKRRNDEKIKSLRESKKRLNDRYKMYQKLEKKIRKLEKDLAWYQEKLDFAEQWIVENLGAHSMEEYLEACESD